MGASEEFTRSFRNDRKTSWQEIRLRLETKGGRLRRSSATAAIPGSGAAQSRAVGGQVGEYRRSCSSRSSQNVTSRKRGSFFCFPGCAVFVGGGSICSVSRES